MYFNVFGEKVSRARHREMVNAQKNRRELIAAGLTRRDLFKMGLLTSAGYLVTKSGLSARASAAPLLPLNQPASPPLRAFIEPLPVMPVKAALNSLSPAPSVNPLPGEGRTRPSQSLTLFPPKKFYKVTQQATNLSVSPDLPVQTMWGFDGMVPGPTYVAKYGEPILVRNFNALPKDDNDGFGIPSVTTHLHNGHTPSESDGFPCDFFEIGHFYDQQYPNVLAGFNSDHISTNGDVNEALSTLWYHDHRVDFTAQNVYKGLNGFYLLFNQFDTGNETTGFRLPGVQASSNPFTPLLYDIPLMLADRVFDPSTGILFFDLFNTDGILGDKFLVNGKIQPFFQVEPRRYRFRLLNAGPSRFYQVFLTDQGSNTQIPFWQVGTDGNLLPHPISVTNTIMGVAQRMDIVIDFKQWAGKTLFFENRMEQVDGRGPTGNTLAAGAGNFLMQFRVGTTVTHADASVDPATNPTFYSLPSTAAAPRVSRTFQFERGNGMWQINGQIMSNDCSQVRVQVQQNSVEHWTLQNNSGGWMHPVHIHFEEHQIMSQNLPLLSTDVSRKDVMRLQHDMSATLFFRFRDFTGRHPLHCHNVVHEDHAMMLRWDIVASGGDTNPNP